MSWYPCGIKSHYYKMTKHVCGILNESVYLMTEGTSTTTPSARFWSRPTVYLLIISILLFVLFLPATQLDRCGHGNTMCLET